MAFRASGLQGVILEQCSIVMAGLVRAPQGAATDSMAAVTAEAGR